MNEVSEIKSRLPIEDLVGQYVKLKKTGRTFKGLCPFHNEKTPSFVVSPDKGIAYCFGCQQGGDVFNFIQLVEKIEFPEAVKLLADKVGIEIKLQSGISQNKKKIQNINEEACRYYQKQLLEKPKAKQYLIERGLSEETIKRFRLGYAPESYDLTHRYLLEQGFDHKEILDAGLAIAKNLTDLKIYDRFRDRVIFPITNVQDQVIAFGGRGMTPEATPKYLNSPETAYYNKSYCLYGLSHAKESIRQQDQVLIVEGYLDVISSVQAKIPFTVASSGTALTTQQIKLLKRYTNNFILGFDNDKAGFEALKRAAEMLLPEDINVQVINLGKAKDPDEFIKKKKDEWPHVIKTAQPLIEFLLDKLKKVFNPQDLSGKKSICKELWSLLHKIANKIEQNYYLEKISHDLNIDLSVIHHEFQRNRNKDFFNSKTKDQPITNSTKLNRSQYLLGLVYNKPDSAKIAYNELNPDFFPNEEIKKVYKIIGDIYNNSRITAQSENNKFNEKQLKIWSLIAEEKCSEFDEDIILAEITRLCKTINKKNLKEKIVILSQELKEKISNPKKCRTILKQINELNKIRQPENIT